MTENQHEPTEHEDQDADPTMQAPPEGRPDGIEDDAVANPEDGPDQQGSENTQGH